MAYSRIDLLKRIGNLSQLGGTRHYTLSDGRAAGTRAIDVDTGSGLVFTVLPDRGMDLSRCTFRGINLVYQGPVGEVSPAHYEPSGLGWLRSFHAGLLTTCGLTHFGSPCVDEGEELGLHGRAGNIPAIRVNDLSGFDENGTWQIVLNGTVEEAVLFGHKLRLHRTIRTSIGATSFTVEDAITNFGFKPSPLMVLYHMNLGYPLVDGGAEVIVNSDDWWPYDSNSESDAARRLAISDPDPAYIQQVFHYRFDGKKEVRAALVNAKLHGGLGLFVKADPTQLPIFNNWKMLGEGDYVVGLEPGNTHVSSRAQHRAEGILPMIAPQETRHFKLEIGVLDGPEAINGFRRTSQ